MAETISRFLYEAGQNTGIVDASFLSGDRLATAPVSGT
jgi:hypothetical protein